LSIAFLIKLRIIKVCFKFRNFF